MNTNNSEQGSTVVEIAIILGVIALGVKFFTPVLAAVWSYLSVNPVF